MPCLLCGEIHELEIHSYPERKIRLPVECRKEVVIIIVILCLKAKSLKKQYTKRILLPFIIPYCVIRRDLVLDCIRKHQDGVMNRQQGMEEMGALDKRTVRRHLGEAKQLTGDAGMTAAGLLASKPSFAAIPERGLTEGPLSYLEAMGKELTRAAQRAKGAAAFTIPALLLLHIQGVWKRHRGTILSMAFVIGAIVFHDTS